jgi:putative oxidoreductase
MKYLPAFLRWLLALIYGFNGINFLFHLMPLPQPQQPVAAQDFIHALIAAGWFFPVMGCVKLGTAICLAANRYVAFALLVMFPILLNGVLFHAVLDPMMLAMAASVGLMHLYLMYMYRNNYLPLLQTTPAIS